MNVTAAPQPRSPATTGAESAMAAVASSNDVDLLTGLLADCLNGAGHLARTSATSVQGTLAELYIPASPHGGGAFRVCLQMVMEDD